MTNATVIAESEELKEKFQGRLFINPEAELYNKREVLNVEHWVFKAIREYKGSFEINERVVGAFVYLNVFIRG